MLLSLGRGISPIGVSSDNNIFDYYTDDAFADRYFTDDALSDPLLLSGGNQLSVDGNFNDSVVNMDFSYVINSDTSTPSVYITPRRTINGSFIPDPGQWGNYMARLNYMNGKTPTVIVSRTGNYFGMLAVNGWFSYDRITWTRFDNATPVSNPSTWNFSHNTPFTSDTVYVAYLPIFSGPEIKQWLTTNESTGYLHETASAVAYGGQDYQIGQTTLGYPIYAVKITDTSATPAGGGAKKKAVIVGGTHPSEVCGSWNVKGLADFLISSDAAAINLRKEFEFWLCFQTTPESRAKGKLRYTFEEDVDGNRNIPGSGSGHEVLIVSNAIQSDYGASGPIDVGIDFHGGIISLYYGFFQTDEPERTDFFNTLDGYVPTALTDSGGFVAGTMAGFFGDTMQAKYYESLEMGLTAITSIADMENYGVYVAKTINDLEGAADMTPAGLSFTDVTGAAVSTQYTANATVTSFTGPLTATVDTGTAEIRKNSTGSWGSSVAVSSGDTINARMTSSASNSTALSSNITLGTVTDTWSVTTVSAGFSPSDISGLQLWLDANDSATITHSSNAVSQWNDKSGNSRHFTQSSAGAKPTTNTRTLNSKNMLDFDGSDWMTSNLEALGSTGLHMAAGQAFTVFVVLDHDANAGYFFGRASAAAGNRGFAILTDAANLQALARGSANRAVKNTWTGTPPSIVTSRWSGTVWQTGYNADALVTQTPGTAAEDTGEKIAIGARTTATTPAIFLDGGIAEIIVYDTSLSDANITSVLNYLNGKWAVY